MTSQRLAQIPDAALMDLLERSYRRVELYMQSLGASALSYGWDWPTAWALRPRLVNKYRRVRRELVYRRRASGLTPDEFIARADGCCEFPLF